MPIENLSGIMRMPRIGKIRLGEMTPSNKEGGSPYPKALDYFRVEEDGGITSKEAAEAFRKVYGDEPRTLDIMFPSNEPEKFFPQFYAAYAKKKGKICQGDGKIAKRWIGEGKERYLEEIECLGEKGCDWYAANKCRRLATLQLILPKVPGLGVWHISTTSRNSIIGVNSGISLIRQLTGGRVSFIPLKLRLREVEVPGPDGFLKKIHVLDLANEDICFADIMQAMNAPPIQALLPDPLEDPRPVDLYPDAVVDEEQQPGATAAPSDKEAGNEADKDTGKNTSTSNNIKPVAYNEVVKILSLPNNKGKLPNVTGKDDHGEVIILCDSKGPLMDSFLALKPETFLNVTGVLKENGKRFVMLEALEIIPI